MDWQMIGHEWAVAHLSAQLDTGGVRQAYLLVGPDAVGKRTLAVRLAQALLCERGGASPCFDCSACRRVAAGRHPDLHLVSSEPDEANLKIDAIRQMQREIALSPYEAERRIVIVPRAHELTNAAANALLKTLEEPPDRVVLLLTARAVEAVPETVSSRCEVLRLRPVGRSKISEQLRAAEATADEAALLSAIANGRPGLALALADDEQLVAHRHDALETVVQLLGEGRQARFDFADKMTKRGDPAAVRARLGGMLAHWLSFWRDVTLVAVNADVTSSNPDFAAQIDALGHDLSTSAAMQALRAVQETMYALLRNANGRLALEALLLRFPYR